MSAAVLTNRVYFAPNFIFEVTFKELLGHYGLGYPLENSREHRTPLLRF
jgi:hypothetical protein